MFTKNPNRNKLLNKRFNLRSQNCYKLKSRLPRILYYNYYASLKFLINFILYPINNKILSLFCTSHGAFFYTISTAKDTLWRFYSIKKHVKSRKIKIKTIWNLICNLKKQMKVSLLSVEFGCEKIKYVRAIGSFAKIYQINKREKFSTIILPSKKKYNISIYKVVSKGFIRKFSKHKEINNHAGYWRKLGKKGNSRGVAMNPVDHPHGGRTKAIKLKRTPWGLPTSKGK